MGTPATNGPAPERGRDLTLLALTLVLAVEAAFLASDVATHGSQVLVRGAGRFALIAGLSYMTWQGFVVSRWVLVALVGAAVLFAPWALSGAFEGGVSAGAVLHIAGAAGYLVAALLLSVSGDVSAFIRHRRELRGSDAF
jgi:hypothetical protein